MIISIVLFLLGILKMIIIVQAIISWLVAFNVINTHNDFVRQLLTLLDRVTEPLYRPIRRFLPTSNGIDFAPMVVLLLLVIFNIILNNIATSIMAGGAL